MLTSWVNKSVSCDGTGKVTMKYAPQGAAVTVEELDTYIRDVRKWRRQQKQGESLLSVIPDQMQKSLKKDFDDSIVAPGKKFK